MFSTSGGNKGARENFFIVIIIIINIALIDSYLDINQGFNIGMVMSTSM